MAGDFPLLDTIKSPEDLRKLEVDELSLLGEELRNYIIQEVTLHGGHFAANLGTVELTIALHYVFNTPIDKIIWDVGHQAYGHKILTGRKDNFHTNRKKDGLSGFPKISESEYDAFGTGHSSTSISAALGMAVAAKLSGKEDQQHIAVIGDGSLTGGMAFEALNNAGVSDCNLLIIVNDNNMGIDPTPGAVNKHLATTKLNRPNLFENLNLRFHGPVDGHCTKTLINNLTTIKTQQGVNVLHVQTIKGKGHEDAEKEQTKWHATSSYVKLKGEDAHIKPNHRKKYQDIFGETLLQIAENDTSVVAVTPAMPTGSSMSFMMKKIPERVFDVGIAEQHAVTFSAGLALENKIPFCNIYSTFLQRAYDQVIHDVAIQKIPVILCLDRAGIVGEDGPTHHGTFDLAYLKPIPNLIVSAPMNEKDLRNLMFTAYKQRDLPFAIRYPRGKSTGKFNETELEELIIGEGEVKVKGEEVAILTLGTIGNFALEAQELLSGEGINPSIYDMRFLKPLDLNLLKNIFSNYKAVLTVEDGSVLGGFGESVALEAVKQGFKGKLEVAGFPDNFIEHGTPSELYSQYKLDAKGIASRVSGLLKG
jgi:1-deoxy-D-xylulose-5-phosphate synthase